MNIPNGNPALVACVIAVVTTGCLDFGSDTELVAPNVSAQHLQEVTKLTGINFPAGSTGLAYLYFGSGIDPSLAIKVQIPFDKKKEFLGNKVFSVGSQSAPTIQIGRSKPWWKLERLVDRIDQTTGTGSENLECTLGTEDGMLVAYISWFTT